MEFIRHFKNINNVGNKFSTIGIVEGGGLISVNSVEETEKNNVLLKLVGYSISKNESVYDFSINGFLIK